MRWPCISDSAVDGLARCAQLKDLNVSRTKITPRGLRKLREALKAAEVTFAQDECK